MAKKVGSQQLPAMLYDIIKHGTWAILATFTEKGVPRTTPLHYIYPKGLESLLITIEKYHSSYLDMVWQKKVRLNFFVPGDTSYSILGRTGVVRAPSSVHPLFHVVRIDVVDIDYDKYCIATIHDTLQWNYVSPEAEELSMSIMHELEDLAKIL